MGVEVASYAPVLSMDDIDSAPDSLFPGILKAARLGYDGKGQVRIETRAQARDAYKTLNNAPCVLEAMEPLVREISIVVARAAKGDTAVYPSSRNAHRDGILAAPTVPPAGQGAHPS